MPIFWQFMTYHFLIHRKARNFGVLRGSIFATSLEVGRVEALKVFQDWRVFDFSDVLVAGGLDRFSADCKGTGGFGRRRYGLKVFGFSGNPNTFPESML